MSPEHPLNPELAVNSRPQIQERVAQRRITWTGPLLVVVSRSALILLAQALFATIFFLRGSPKPWLAAAPWWSVYGTIVDFGCLALMWKFTRAEGVTLRDLIGAIRLRYGRDFFLGIGVYLVVFPFFVAGGLLSGLWLYGTYHVDVFPGLLGGRVLPLWAVLYSKSVWWLIWSPTEEMTYAGYVLPRIQALSGRTWVAVAVVGFWWTIQHPFLPFIPEWRNFIWRFFAFLPGVIVLILIYLRTRRLAPLILAHWMMDIVATFMTIQS